MKNRIISSLFYIITGFLIAVGPSEIFKVCNSVNMKGPCQYTKQAELGIGILIIAIGIISFLIKDKKVRLGLGIAQGLNAVLVLAFPLWLTGLCKMKTMACHVKTLPSLIVLSVILLIISVVNGLYLLKEE